MANKKRAGLSQPIIRFLFLVYIGLMIWLLFIQRLDSDMAVNSENLNLIPFKTLSLYWHLLRSDSAFYSKQAIINLAGNVVMFVPFGIFIPVIWTRFRKFLSFAILAVVLIVAIELLQFVTSLGSCDVDDFILNFPGMILGYALTNCKAVFRR